MAKVLKKLVLTNCGFNSKKTATPKVSEKTKRKFKEQDQRKGRLQLFGR